MFKHFLKAKGAREKRTVPKEKRLVLDLASDAFLAWMGRARSRRTNLSGLAVLRIQLHCQPAKVQIGISEVSLGTAGHRVTDRQFRTGVQTLTK